MDLEVTHKKTWDYVQCPNTKRKTSVNTCLTCQYLRIVLAEKVKCGFKEIVESNSLHDSSIIPRNADGLKYGY